MKRLACLLFVVPLIAMQTNDSERQAAMMYHTITTQPNGVNESAKFKALEKNLSDKQCICLGGTTATCTGGTVSLIFAALDPSGTSALTAGLVLCSFGLFGAGGMTGMSIAQHEVRRIEDH